MTIRNSVLFALAGSVALTISSTAFAGTFDDGAFTLTATESQTHTTHAGAVTFADSSTFAGYSGNLSLSVATISGGASNGGTNPDSGIDNSISNWASAPGDLTIAFNANQTYFGMLWGSIDTYNTMEIFEGTTLLDTITGTTLNTETGAPFYSAPGSFVDFVADGSSNTFDKIVFSSNGCCFETVNYAALRATQTNVPEPFTLSVFGIGIAGAAALRRRRNVGKAA